MKTGNTFGDGVSHAMVGGTVSVISGGKFANGAVTSAFTYAFGRTIGARTRRAAAEGDAGTSKLGTPGEGMPDEPNSDTLKFMKSIAGPIGDASGTFEYISSYYATDDGLVADEMDTQESHISSRGFRVKMPGWEYKGDIHGHPSPGPHKVNAADLAVLPGNFKVGQKIIVKSNVFSSADIQGYKQDGVDGWVVPHGTGKLLYFPHKNNPNNYHYEYSIP